MKPETGKSSACRLQREALERTLAEMQQLLAKEAADMETMKTEISSMQSSAHVGGFDGLAPCFFSGLIIIEGYGFYWPL